MPVSLGIKNLTGADVTIQDLGLIVPTSTSIDLTGAFPPDGLRFSFDLQTAVQNDQVVITENGIQKSKEASLIFITGGQLNAEIITVIAGSNMTVSSGTNSISYNLSPTITGLTSIIAGTVSGTSGAFGQGLTAQTGGFSTGLTVSGIPVSIIDSFEDNLLINGDFFINQRRGSENCSSTTVPANNDDTYILDRWILLSNGNNIVEVSRSLASDGSGAAPRGSRSCLLTITVAADTKFGFLQIVENSVSLAAIGGRVSLQLKISNGGFADFGSIRAGIVYCTSAADSVTSDIVSAWNGENTNPTLISSWNFANTPIDLPVGQSLGTYSLAKIEDIIIPSTANNIGVFVWSNDVTVRAGFIGLYLTDIKLEVGSKCTPFRARPPTVEISLAQRYFCKTFPYLTPIGDNQNTAGCISVWSVSNSAGSVRYRWGFPVTMRATPTITTYNPLAGTAGTWDRAGTSIAATTFANSTEGVTLVANAGTSANAIHNIHVSAEAEL